MLLSCWHTAAKLQADNKKLCCIKVDLHWKCVNVRKEVGNKLEEAAGHRRRCCLAHSKMALNVTCQTD